LKEETRVKQLNYHSYFKDIDWCQKKCKKISHVSLGVEIEYSNGGEGVQREDKKKLMCRA